ncbi:rhodanese-like domain-containing protein [Mariprofundus erugo]|nr:rhodanese-like domain-containing protein [Mariprofundus erugo]
MKRILLTIATLVMMPFMTSACGMGEQTPEGYENVPVEHAMQQWKEGMMPFLFLDVRSQEEYAQGHIAGAMLIPVDELAGRMNEVPKNRQVYVYCHSGKRSARASALLASHGFTRIENIVGGIEAWKQAGYPVEK